MSCDKYKPEDYLDAAKWAVSVSEYFINRSTLGEDKNYWSNVYNHGNAKKVADMLLLAARQRLGDENNNCRPKTKGDK